MRKLKNIAVITLVVAVLIVGGVTGYLWYGAKQQVDHIVAAAQPFAHIDYDGVTVSPEGFISVNRVRITPHSVTDTISIGSIRLNAPNLFALLKLRWQFSQGRLPDALSLSYHDIELPLQGGILNTPVSAAERSPLDALDALGCGPVVRFGGAEWQEMGYDRLIGNLAFGYRLDPTRSRLELRMDGNVRDWMTMNMDMSLIAPTPPTVLTDLAAFSPKPATFNLVIRDDGFNHRRDRYCAAKSGKPVNEYLADHVRLVVEHLRVGGVYPGPGLIAAYQGYLAEGGELVVTAAPPTPIHPAELSGYKPADAIKLLGLTLKVNNTAITDFTVTWDTAKIAKTLSFGPEPKAEAEEVAPAPPPEKPVVIQKTLHPTPVGDLGKHIGKPAKLRTVASVEYKGQLQSVGDGIVQITIRKSGGSATLSLRAGDIASAEVLY